MKTLIKYPGSKWSIANWILSFFPEHRSYVEPFLGSGAVFFKKERSPIETINDRDDEVVCFFEQVKSDPEKLAHEIYFTPYARTVYQRAYEKPKNRLETAVNFCTRLNMGHGFRTTGERVGWKSDIREGEAAADFISCVAFGKIAEVAEKYLHKGTKIIIAGRLQTGSYTDRDGRKVYTTEVIVEDQEFAESKKSQNDFMDMPEGEKLPFT